MRGANKLKVLVEKFGDRGFDYAGNSRADLAVWRCAREAIVVNAGRALTRRAARCARLGPVFPFDLPRTRAFVSCLHLHQWVQNTIIFVPALAAHKLGEPAVLLRAGWAFIAFCLCASSMYILNDLVDLDADRQHSTRKPSPFAAGDLPLQTGLILSPALLMASVLVSLPLSGRFTAILAFYVVVTMTCSWQFKRIPLLDVFLLAGLYTLRLIAGYVVTGVKYSLWLFLVAIFIFLSLALMKHFRGLRVISRKRAGPQLPG